MVQQMLADLKPLSLFKEGFNLVPRAHVTLVLRNRKTNICFPVPQDKGNIGSGDKIKRAYAAFEHVKVQWQELGFSQNPLNVL